jgi:hypothetical protein
MAFPHPKPRKEQYRKKDIPNTGGVVVSIRRRIINVTEYRNATDDGIVRRLSRFRPSSDQSGCKRWTAVASLATHLGRWRENDGRKQRVEDDRSEPGRVLLYPFHRESCDNWRK